METSKTYNLNLTSYQHTKTGTRWQNAWIVRCSGPQRTSNNWAARWNDVHSHVQPLSTAKRPWRQQVIPADPREIIYRWQIPADLSFFYKLNTSRTRSSFAVGSVRPHNQTRSWEDHIEHCLRVQADSWSWNCSDKSKENIREGNQESIPQSASKYHHWTTYSEK